MSKKNMVNLKKWCVNSERWNSNSKQSKRKKSETCQLQIWEGLKKRFGGLIQASLYGRQTHMCILCIFKYLHTYLQSK